MSDLEAAKFDDELLSAYLDDELTPAERARVDERLAADPAAQQLLDELRTVSRAMKEFPAATLGADLRESVLRRAERAMLVSGERAPASGAGSVIRSIPIGRSKRAWFWAVSALAAGLLLMVFQRAPERNNGLPGQVAQGDRNELVRDEALPPLEMKALEPAREVAAGVPIAATADPSPPTDSLAKTVAPSSGSSFGVVADESIVTRPMDLESSARESSVSSSGVGGGGGLGGHGGATVALGTPVVDAAGEDLLVVHVSMKREAKLNNAFDNLLYRNQIEVEAPAVDKAAPSDPEDVDVVMVEASPAQVYSALADMNKDSANYVGIAVDDRLATTQRSLAAKRPEADVMQYNRGSVQNQQQPELAPDNNYYYSTNRGRVAIERTLGDESEAETQRFGGGELDYGVPGRAKRFAQSADAEDDTSGRTAALQKTSPAAPLAAANSPAPASEAGKHYSESQRNVARRAYQKLAAKADMLQVLFVLSYADEPANTAASSQVPAAALPSATDRTTSPVETEEGLKSRE